MSNNTTADVTGIFSLDTNRLVGLAAKGSPDVTYLAGQDTPTSGIPLTATLSDGGNVFVLAGDSAFYPAVTFISAGDSQDEIKINDALKKNRYVKIISNSVISGPIIMNSGNTLEIEPGVTIKLADGLIHGPMITNSAEAMIRQSSCSMTAGSYIISDSSISPADVGKSVIVTGAGHGGTQGIATILCATILSASNGVATLNTPAVTSVSGAVSKYYNRDKKITVIGGDFDFNNGNNPGSANSDGYFNSAHVCKFRRVDGLKLAGQTIKTNAGKYAFSLADVTDYEVINPTFNTFSDGIHISGPAFMGKLSGLRGKTGDDYVGVTAMDYKFYADTQGDVLDLTISDVAMSNSGGGRLLLLGGPGLLVSDVVVNKMRGKSRGIVLESGTVDANMVPLFNSNIGRVSISDVDMLMPTGYAEVTIKAENTSSLKVSGLICKNPDNGHQYIVVEKPVNLLMLRDSHKLIENITTNQFFIAVGSTATVNKAVIRGCSSSSPSGSYVNSLINVVGKVDSLIIDEISISNGSYSASFNSVFAVATGANVGSVIVSNVIANFIKVLVQQGSGATMGQVIVSDVRMNSCSRLAESAANLDIILSNVKITAPYSEAINILNGATLTVGGSGCYFDPSKDGVSRSGSETIRVKSFDFPVDSAKLSGVIGDRHYNTNAASGALKVGPCIYTGTAWKSLIDSL